MPKLIPLNLMQWIDEHRPMLEPPVGNAQIWKDAEFMVTVVGGPNRRKDYHVDPGEEFFYQLEGDMVLKVVEDGEFRDIDIREGEIFLLPPNVPHSPQRSADTVGVVIERTRREGELDTLRWYCDACRGVLFERSFHLTDLTTQLQPVFEEYYSDVAHRTCRSCGAVQERPA